MNLHKRLLVSNHFLIQNENTPLNGDTFCGAKVGQEYDKTKHDINAQVNLTLLFEKSAPDARQYVGHSYTQNFNVDQSVIYSAVSFVTLLYLFYKKKSLISNILVEDQHDDLILLIFKPPL